MLWIFLFLVVFNRAGNQSVEFVHLLITLIQDGFSLLSLLGYDRNLRKFSGPCNWLKFFGVRFCTCVLRDNPLLLLGTRLLLLSLNFRSLTLLNLSILHLKIYFWRIFLFTILCHSKAKFLPLYLGPVIIHIRHFL